MEISFCTGKLSSLFNKQRSKNTMKNFVVSCRNKEFSMQQGKKTNNYYQLLSLPSENVGYEEIKKAYRSKALKYHPDACPSSIKEECTKQFVELRKAYEVLSDPESRKMYDYELSLVDSFCGYGFRGLGRQRSLSRKAWEVQLSGLRNRSLDRMEKKKKKKKEKENKDRF